MAGMKAEDVKEGEKYYTIVDNAEYDQYDNHPPLYPRLMVAKWRKMPGGTRLDMLPIDAKTGKSYTPSSPYMANLWQVFPDLESALAAYKEMAEDHLKWVYEQLVGYRQQLIREDCLPAAEKYAILDIFFDVTERGNIWLANDEEPWHNAYIRLNSRLWFEISIRPENYPGLTVRSIYLTDAKLAAHINREFNSGGWSARKCNLEGVILTEDGTHILGVPGE